MSLTWFLLVLMMIRFDDVLGETLISKKGKK